MSRRGKKGQLSPEDKELWAKVAKTLTPLDPDRLKVLEAQLPENQPSPPAERGNEPHTATAIHEPKRTLRPAPLPPLHQLEHRYRKKLARGGKSIDARLDLHGLTQHQAHDRLRAFLYRAQAHGHQIVLVITGKGGSGFLDERGVLRRQVPQWLSMPDIRHLVVGYEEAHAAHGGSGALYVRIRRKR